VTAKEAFDLTTSGGANDFAKAIALCQKYGPYCLIGGLAVNCYAEPVYTLDADIVVITSQLQKVTENLKKAGFGVESFEHSINAQFPGSQLRIQFTTDRRYQAFVERAREQEVLGVKVQVACLEDVTQGKLWACADSKRRLTKRKKDELDLLRLAEVHPQLLSLLPEELRKLTE
jgi:hypothetical protein